jgi:hypothetical protein
MAWPRFIACANASPVAGEQAARWGGDQHQTVSIVRGFWFAPEIASYHRGRTDTRPIVTSRHDRLVLEKGCRG